MHNKNHHQRPLTIPWRTITFFFVTVALFFILPNGPTSLLYDRYAISSGQVWRLLCGHFVHCDLPHLGWNIAAFALLGTLLEQQMGKNIIRVILTSCLGVSAWLWFAKSDLLLYCGLSGMLNGMLAVLLCTMWREQQHPLIALTAVGAMAKIAFESFSGQAIFTHLSWQSVPGAHGAGFVSGLLYYCVTLWKAELDKQATQQGKEKRPNRLFRSFLHTQ